jgi:hypothetical protein
VVVKLEKVERIQKVKQNIIEISYLINPAVFE